MNLDSFLSFVKKNISYFSQEELQFVLDGKYKELILSMNNKASNDKKNKKKYKKIINFFIKFIEDLSKNSYKYNYNKANSFKEFKYWYDFYVDNKLFSQAKNIIDQMENKKIWDKKISKLKKNLEKNEIAYEKEYKRIEGSMKKENIIRSIEYMVKSWEHQKALMFAIKSMKIYPNDKKLQYYIDEIHNLKSSNLNINVEKNDDFLSKVWMLDYVSKKELDKKDLKEIYKKIDFLIKIKDWENWLKFVSYLKDTRNIKDKKIVNSFNKFVQIKNKHQKQQQYQQFNVELKTVQLMLKNKQYKDALLRANMLLRKYPFVKKKSLFSIIKKIQKRMSSYKKTSQESSIDKFLMKISVLNKKWMYEFYQKMAWFLKSKIDIKTTLNIIYHQSKDLWLKKFVGDLLNWIDSWMTLSESMWFYKQIWQLDIALIKVWENTWKLATLFENIYTTKKEEDERRKKIKSIMIYPSIVISIAILIFIWLLIFIIPKFVWLFENLGVDLPYLTQKILQLSNFVQTKWYLVVLFMFWFFIFYKLFSKTNPGKYFNSYLALNLPVFNKIAPVKYLVYFTSNLSLLLKSWVSITESLDIIIYWTENVLFKDEFTRLKFELEWWLSLWKAIWIWDVQEIWNYSNRYIPIDIAYTMDIWDKTWQLSSLLEEISDKYDQELKLTIKNLQNLIEPFVILLIWSIVLLFALSVFLPLIQMYDAVWSKWWL